MINPEFIFAAKYPFSSSAIKLVEKQGTDFNKIPGPVLKKSFKAILFARNKKTLPLLSDENEASLKEEILSFPVIKIVLSFINDSLLSRHFAIAFKKRLIENLQKENTETLFDLAREIKIKPNIVSQKDFFCSIQLTDFLSLELESAEFKLVNQALANGLVFISKNNFARLIAESIELNLVRQLPLPEKSLPQGLKEVCFDFKQQLKSKEEKEFESSIKSFAQKKKFGRIDFSKIQLFPSIEALPPCIKQGYDSLLAGKNLNHIQRLATASFLLACNFPMEKVKELFAKAPNYNEGMTSYHLNRIKKQGFEKGFRLFGCAKTKEYGFCANECSVKHPMNFYKKKLLDSASKIIEDKEIAFKEAENKKIENKKNDSKEISGKKK